MITIARTSNPLAKIVSDPFFLDGAPVVRGTWIPVAAVLATLAEQKSTSGVCLHFPQLSDDDIWACVEYAATKL
jgi:uncharacterized protein (DUF433 family)